MHTQNQDRSILEIVCDPLELYHLLQRGGVEEENDRNRTTT